MSDFHWSNRSDRELTRSSTSWGAKVVFSLRASPKPFQPVATGSLFNLKAQSAIRMAKGKPHEQDANRTASRSMSSPLRLRSRILSATFKDKQQIISNSMEIGG